jgi:[protein-PII] uridylyltransferase
MAASAILGTLRDLSVTESEAIEKEFTASGDGLAGLRARTALADRLVLTLYAHSFSEAFGGALARVDGLCLIALGGYGRRSLFPHSDIDLLFLCGTSRAEAAAKEPAAAVARHLWDIGWRASITSRTPPECERFEPGNPEFTFSLLDCRYLAGDAGLFTDLRDGVLPGLAAHESSAIIRSLSEITTARHARFGHTIYHLEPNLKDGPGGLRDYQLAGWLDLLRDLTRHRRWPLRDINAPEPLGQDAAQALEFYCAVRVFLHYRSGRDDNRLTWELQDEACASGIGRVPRKPCTAEEWMRIYFHHARNVFALACGRLEEVTAARPSLYTSFRDWASRFANADFYVLRGRVLPRQPAALEDPAVLLGLFEFVARHGIAPSTETESAAEKAAGCLAAACGASPKPFDAWPQFRRILVLPHAAAALRAMHRLGVLDALFPEFRAIEALVVRDLYHRYTVDEHTLLTIENLRALTRAATDAERRLAEIYSELEQPELLALALLFHDVGKGLSAENHVQASLGAVEGVFARLRLSESEREIVRFLIRRHLDMSATLQRRDIFDPETVRAFAESVGSPERLKLLCLFTYADIKSVSPEALTAWKAEMLWRLYAAATNDLVRGVDDQRVSPAADMARVEQLEKTLAPDVSQADVAAFLEGFPRRYVETHSPPEIGADLAAARRLQESGVELRLEPRGHSMELTVITRDRPRLFARLSGALAGWGMNILKADAYANRAGVVVDTFRFADPFRTLELNAIEVERFLADIREILGSSGKLDALLHGRTRRGPPLRPRAQISAEVRFDNSYSSHSTVLELVARDRPGLLYDVSSALADAGFNIEVALIDTQGEKAIDVFYLTLDGRKLDKTHQEGLREVLLRRLES